jgi:hypothetical protein
MYNGTIPVIIGIAPLPGPELALPSRILFSRYKMQIISNDSVNRQNLHEYTVAVLELPVARRGSMRTGHNSLS